jgi:hypothetical protein
MTGVNARRGCLALASVPLLLLAAPIEAWRRRTGARRRGSDLIVAVRRSRFGAVNRVAIDLDAPNSRWVEVAGAVSAMLAESAAALDHTIGCVGIVSGEEPILLALAPRRDLVAARAMTVLTSAGPHRCPQLWLTLPRGGFLAQVVDPDVAFSFDEGRLLDGLAAGRVGHAVHFAVTSDAVAHRLTLTAYLPRHESRKIFALGRERLAAFPGWRTAR